MGDRAGVRSTKALAEVRAALIEFIDAARGSLAAAETELQRTGQWLNQDRPAHWKSELRRREDAVLAAKLEIERKRLIKAPDPASVVLEQRELRRAVDRRDSAATRKRNTELWVGRFDRQALLTKTSTHKLGEALNSTLPRGIAALERMITTLESYTQIRSRFQPPEAVTDDRASELKEREA
ncbi:MAG: hypothetical protein ACK54H_11985 [Phycisphaerales bacterium]